MADIFLSYASSNRSKAKVLRDWFERAGWSVWWDREIDLDDNWEARLRAELDAAKAVVVVWCPQSRWSPWVRTEARLAREAGRLVHIKATGLDLPAEFRDLQWARFEAWDGEDWHREAPRLLRKVAALVGTEPREMPEPDVGGSTPMDRLEVAQLALQFCAIRVEFFARNARGEWVSEVIEEELRHTFDRLHEMLAPIENHAMHELVTPFMETLQAALPPSVPQGEFAQEARSPFVDATG
jgi:adenylate cyclase